MRGVFKVRGRDGVEKENDPEKGTGIVGLV